MPKEKSQFRVLTYLFSPTETNSLQVRVGIMHSHWFSVRIVAHIEANVASALHPPCCLLPLWISHHLLFHNCILAGPLACSCDIHLVVSLVAITLRDQTIKSEPSAACPRATLLPTTTTAIEFLVAGFFPPLTKCQQPCCIRLPSRGHQNTHSNSPIAQGSRQTGTPQPLSLRRIRHHGAATFSLLNSPLPLVSHGAEPWIQKIRGPIPPRRPSQPLINPHPY